MTADLVWATVRNNSSFLVKRDGQQFTTEPLNVTNVNSYKFSGLANVKAVGVAQEGDKIVFQQKRKANKGVASSTLAKHFKNGNCSAASAINAATTGNYYRADLAKFAKARYHAIFAAKRRNKAGVAIQKSGRRSSK
mmetsp:Transcript_158394/g.384684  ORF Transcript_158394/g.384684 Transcript_158394/m.384684 type:complete len:137 (+) Transcript_158394:44-454(+)